VKSRETFTKRPHILFARGLNFIDKKGLDTRKKDIAEIKRKLAALPTFLEKPLESLTP
jgi:hypothetical protein